MTCAIAQGVTGVVGVNGAGKSTLMSLLSTSREPTSGTMSWGTGGDSLREVRHAISWVPQNAPLPRMFTVREFLEYSCFLKGVPRRTRADRIAESLSAFDLVELADKKCGALSGGQARRLVLAWGLLSRPRVLLLDEPTAGLDVYQRRTVRGLLKANLASTVIVSSHLFSDLVGVADHLLVLDGGELRFAGTMRQAEAVIAQADRAGESEEQLIALIDSSRRSAP